MAEFNTHCPHCNTELVADEDWNGMEVECPSCHKNFVITVYTGKNIEPFANVAEKGNAVHRNNKKTWCILAITGFACIIITILSICLSSYFSLESTANRKLASLKKSNLEILHPYIEKKIRTCKSRSEVNNFQIPNNLIITVQESKKGDIKALTELYKAYLDPNLLNNSVEATKILYSLAMRQESFAIQILLKNVTDGKNTSADNAMFAKLAARNNMLVINYFKQRNVMDNLMFDIMQNAMKSRNEELWKYLYQIGFCENRKEYIELCGKYLASDPRGEKALALSDYYKYKQKDMKAYGKWLLSAANRRNKLGMRRFGHFLLTQPNENRGLGISFLKLNKNDSVSLYYLGKFFITDKKDGNKKYGNMYLKRAIKLFKKEIQTTQDPEVKYSYAICCLYPYDGSKPQVDTGLKILNGLADESYTDALIALAYLYDKGYLSIKKSEEKSIIYIKLLADKEIASFQYLYAGYLVKQKKYAEAFAYYTKAANQQDINSICALGYMYKKGFGCKQDLSKARSYLEIASAKKNTDAMVGYASMLLNGEGGTKDTQKAESLLKDVLKQKTSVIAAEMLADMYLANKQENDAFHYYYIAKKSGSKKGEKFIADYYTKIKKSFDSDKIKIQTLLSNGKNEEAKVIMNKYRKIDIPEIRQFFYDYYISIKKYKTARFYCRKLIDFGRTDAYRNYGIMLFHGLGGKKDLAYAKQMFSHGVRLNDSESVNYLGYMNAVGIGMQKNEAYAVKLFKYGANLSNVNALRNAGLMYSAGCGVARNFKQAIRYYSIAVKIADKPKTRLQLEYVQNLGNTYNALEKSYYNHQAKYYKTGMISSFDCGRMQEKARHLRGNTRYHFYISDIEGKSLLCQYDEPIATWDHLWKMAQVNVDSKFEQQRRKQRVIETMIRHQAPPSNMCPICGGAGYRTVGQSLQNPRGEREQCYMCLGSGIKPKDYNRLK